MFLSTLSHDVCTLANKEQNTIALKHLNDGKTGTSKNSGYNYITHIINVINVYCAVLAFIIDLFIGRDFFPVIFASP